MAASIQHKTAVIIFRIKYELVTFALTDPCALFTKSIIIIITFYYQFQIGTVAMRKKTDSSQRTLTMLDQLTSQVEKYKVLICVIIIIYHPDRPASQTPTYLGCIWFDPSKPSISFQIIVPYLSIFTYCLAWTLYMVFILFDMLLFFQHRKRLKNWEVGTNWWPKNKQKCPRW